MSKNKKIFVIKLVTTNKLIIVLMLLLNQPLLSAQDTWTLEQCLDTAQLHNKTLLMSRNGIAISKEKEAEAKANHIPKIGINADYKYFLELPTQLMPMNALNPNAPDGQFKDLQFGVPHNINANLQLTLPLYQPQLQGAIKNTKIASELTELQRQKTEEQIVYDITTLYYNAQILKHQLAFLDSNLINTKKLLSNMQLLKEQLLAKGSDVNKVKLQAEQLTTQREMAHNKYVQLLDVIKINMGIDLERPLDVTAEILVEPDRTGASQPIIDLQMIQVQNKLLKNELYTMTQSRLLPSVSFIASYGTSGFGYDKKPNQFLRFYPVGFAGIQLSYPLFNGTVTQRKINQKKLEMANNVLQAQLITEKNKMEIENAIKQKIVTKKAITNTQSHIALAQTVYDQNILQQKQGVASLTDVLLADNALREAQQNYLSAVVDFLKAELELKKHRGDLKVKR